MKTKTFDCVEMKHRGSLEVYETVKSMTVEQEMNYWRDKTDELRARLDAQRRKRTPKNRHTA
jgi:hypothetical protein